MLRDDLDRYDEVVLTCESETVLRLVLTPSRRALLGATWDALEAELGRRMDFAEVIGAMSRRTVARAGV